MYLKRSSALKFPRNRLAYCSYFSGIGPPISILTFLCSSRSFFNTQTTLSSPFCGVILPKNPIVTPSSVLRLLTLWKDTKSTPCGITQIFSDLMPKERSEWRPVSEAQWKELTNALSRMCSQGAKRSTDLTTDRDSISVLMIAFEYLRVSLPSNRGKLEPTKRLFEWMMS